MSIYVESLIRAPMDALWSHTQTPDLHERWDLRFSRIAYIPKTTESEPQHFGYATRIGFGLEITGVGESVGSRDLPGGSRSSVLKFSSADPRSIISEGSGYWKYIPAGDGIIFLTGYDYSTRFGRPGALFDRVIFRPLMGWATAWSFDRLRLWLEKGIDPQLAMRCMLVHAVARLSLAFIFAYHGLVPKLIASDPDEVAMLGNAGIPPELTGTAMILLGLAELLFAAGLLVYWRRKEPVIIALVMMFIATIGVAVTSPRYLVAAFNPVSLNLAIICLAAIDMIVIDDVPSAARCRRRPGSGTA
jgi:hypothetical protein